MLRARATCTGSRAPRSTRRSPTTAAAPLTGGVVRRGLRDRPRASGDRRRAHDGPVELLFVGRLERRKGVDVLLEALRSWSPRAATLRLTLVGRHGDCAPLAAARRELASGCASRAP